MITAFAAILAALVGLLTQPSTAAPAAATPAPRPDQWWTERHESFNARARQGREKGDIGMIFLGDSITEGWLGAGKEVWNERYEPRRAVDFGIGGDRTQHLLYRVQNGNLDGLARPSPEGARGPALAVIMIGTNNTADDPGADIAAGIEAVVNAVRERLPDTPILLLGVFPRGDPGDPAREKIKEINTRIARLENGKSVHYLDIGGVFLDKDGAIPQDVMPDKLHLSAKGYRMWADAMESETRELLAGGPQPDGRTAR